MAVAAGALTLCACSDDDKDLDINNYGAYERLPEGLIDNLSSNFEYRGTCYTLVYGPENGYSEDTWHFVYEGSDYYWPYKGLHVVQFSPDSRTVASLGHDEPVTRFGDYLTPLLPQDKALPILGDNILIVTTPDNRRTYRIFNGDADILYTKDGDRTILLPSTGGSEYGYVIMTDTDLYSKGTGGSGGGTGGSGSYDRVSTKVFEVWTYGYGMSKTVKQSDRWWYKGEVGGKVCLFKTQHGSGFMVASRNPDTNCEGYSVGSYSYKVTEQTITSGTYYYYFN